VNFWGLKGIPILGLISIWSNAGDSSQCDCSSNRACVDLGHYMSVPAYLREALWAYQLGDPSERGIY